MGVFVFKGINAIAGAKCFCHLERAVTGEGSNLHDPLIALRLRSSFVETTDQLPGEHLWYFHGLVRLFAKFFINVGFKALSA